MASNISNLVYYYRFETSDLSGNTLDNLATNSAYDLSLSSVSLINTNNYFVGQSSLNLNNTSTEKQWANWPSGITLPSSASGFSISFWISGLNLSSDNARIFDFSNSTDTISDPGKNAFYANLTNNVLTVNLVSAGSNIGSLTCPVVETDGIWRHVLITYSSANVVSIYVNGQLCVSSTFSDYPSTSYTYAYLGNDTTQSSYFLTGTLDEFRIYNIVLSDVNDINYLAYYPTYQPYTNSTSISGNAFSSNFYDSNQTSFTQYFGPRTVFPGTIVLFSGKPGQNVSAFDGTANTYTYVSPIYLLIDTYSTKLYVCDSNTGKLVQTDLSTGKTITLYTTPNITSVAIDASNTTYYVSDNVGNIRAFDLSTNTLNGNVLNGAYTNVTCLLLAPNNSRLYFSHSAGVSYISLPITSYPATPTLLYSYSPGFLEIVFPQTGSGTGSTIYAIDSSDQTIYAVNTGATNTAYTITMPSNALLPGTKLSDCAFDTQGNMYISTHTGSCGIYMVPFYVINAISSNTTLTSAQLKLFAGGGTYGYSGDGGPCLNAQFGKIECLICDLMDNLYFVDSMYAVVRKITGTGGKGTKFMNNIQNEAGLDGYHDIAKIYSQTTSVGSTPEQVPLAYGTDGLLANKIDGRFQTASHSIVDNSGLVIYYKFNSTDVSGAYIANYATGMPVYDASLNYDLSNVLVSPYISSSEFASENSALNLSSTTLGTWQSITNVPPAGSGLPALPHIITPNRDYTSTRFYGSRFGHWNSVSASATGSYVGAVGDFDVFYQNNKAQTAGPQLGWTPMYSPPVTSTVLGTGGNAFTGDLGLALSAQTQRMIGLRIINGDYYVADSLSHRVRRVYSASGFVNTICGTGAASSTGDGGLATAATINTPTDVLMDASNNIYISELYKIRVIYGNGIISTFAGTGTAGSAGDRGLATAATFNVIKSMEFDSSYNMYVVEDTGNRVRIIYNGNNIVGTIAGGGVGGDGGQASAASLNKPQFVAIDNSRNVFISEQSANKIRLVTYSTGIISTVIGSGINPNGGITGLNASILGPSGLTFDASKNNLYFAQTTLGKISYYNVKSGLVYNVLNKGNIVGGPAMDTNPLILQANSPQALRMDASDNLYFIDSLNFKLRRISTITPFPGFTQSPFPIASMLSCGGLSWEFIKLSGTGQYQFAYAKFYGAFLSSSYGTNTSWNYVLDLSGIYIKSGAMSFTGQYMSAVDPYGNVYVSSGYGANGTWSRKYTNTSNTFLSPGTHSIAMSTTGQYQVATTYSTETVYPFMGIQASNGYTEGIPPAVQINGICTLAFDTSNNMYFADRFNHRLRKYTLNTNTTTLIMGTGVNGYPAASGTASGSNLSYPKGIAIDASNNIYINIYYGIIYVYGTLYVSLAGSGTTGSAGDTLIMSASTSFAANQYLAVNQLGDISITDYTNNKIRTITAGNTFTSTIVGTGTATNTGDGGLATIATITNPIGIDYDAFNNMYLSCPTANTIRKVDVFTGIISTIAGTGTASSTGDNGPAQSATINSPWIKVDSYNNVYSIENASSCIRRIAPINNQTTGLSKIIPYVNSAKSAGSTGNFGPPDSAKISAPEHAMFYDNYNNAYFTDIGNATIRKIMQSTNIIVSTDYGQTWTNKTSSLTGNILFNNVAINSTGQYMSATTINGNIYNCRGNIYTSSDFGNTWTLNTSVPTYPWGCIAISSTGQYQFAAGYDMSGGYYSADYGQNWTIGNLPHGNWCQLSWVEAKNTMYAVTKNIGSFTSVFYNTNFNLAAAGTRNSQYVATGNTLVSSVSWPTVNGITFATWIKSNNNANYAKIFDFGAGSPSNNVIAGVYGNVLYYGVYNGTTPGNTITQIGINDNSWKHIAITMTYAASGATTSIHSVYLNGVIATTNYNTGNTRYPNQVARPSCYIGKGALITDPSFNGVIDDFRVYNRVLTDREIYKLYAPSEAVHLYRFDNEDYDQTGVFLANYAPKNVVWDGLHTCKFTPPPLITVNTTATLTVKNRMFSGLTGNLVCFAINQSNDYGVTVYNGLTNQFTFFNSAANAWAALTNTNILSNNITCCKMISSGAEMIMGVPSNGSSTGLMMCNRTSANAFYLNQWCDSTNRDYNGVDTTLSGNRFVAVADYVYFGEWNSSLYNYNICSQTNLYTGLTRATQKDIAITGDGSRIVYTDLSSNLYFATWDSSLYTYTGATLISSLTANTYTGITLSNDGLLLFYAFNVGGTISLYYAIWNGSTYAGITNVSSVISTSYLIYSLSNVKIKLTYDMKTLYLTSNGYNGSTYNGFVIPISLTYSNTMSGYRKTGSNCLTMQTDSLCIARNHPLPTVSSYTINPFTVANVANFLAVSDDYSKCIYGNGTTGLMYYSLYYPNTYSWSAFATTLQSTLPGGLNSIDGKLTSDGLRGVVITSAAAYFYTWNGINYSTYTRTLDTSPYTYLSCDLTNDGSRFFVMTASYIYYADWNGTNYGQFISTGIPNIGAIGSYSPIGCAGDGLRIAYSFFDGTGVAAGNGNIWYAFWNGTNYIQYSSPVYTHTNAVGIVRALRMSKDGIFLIHTWINSTNSPRLFAWMQNNYVYMLNMSSLGTTATNGLAVLPNLDKVIIVNNTPTSIQVRLYWAKVLSYYAPYATTIPYFYSAGTSGYMGSAVSASDNIMVFANYVTNYIYYTTKLPFANTWNLKNLQTTLQSLVTPGNSIMSIRLLPNGKSGFFNVSNGNIYYFTWVPEKNNFSNGAILTVPPGIGGRAFVTTYDGSRLFVGSQSLIYYANFNGNTTVGWISTGFASGSSQTVSIGTNGDGSRIFYITTNSTYYMYYAQWTGYTYVQIDWITFLNGLAGTYNLCANYDGMYFFYQRQDGTYPVVYFMWDGTKYTDFTTIPSTTVLSGLIDFSGDRKKLYSFSQNPINFGQTQINAQTAPIVASFTIPSPYSSITSFGNYSTLSRSSTLTTCKGMAFTQDGSRMVIADETTGLMYFATKSGGTWSALQQTLQTTQLGAGYALQIRLTADGSRGVMSIGTSYTVYFFTWTGTNYSAYQTTAITGASNFNGFDLTADGKRIFLVNTTAIYWSDWNGISYGPVQTTSIAGTATNGFIACNTDGSRIVYNINASLWTYATWNGTNYIAQNTFTSIVAGLSIRDVIWSYDNQYVFWTISGNASGSIAYAAWNQDLNNFTNSAYLSTSAAPGTLTNWAIGIDNNTVYQVTNTSPTIYSSTLNYTTIPSAVQGYSFAYWFKNQCSQDYAGLFSFQGVNGWIMMFLIGNDLYATVNEQTFSLPTNVLPTTMQNHVKVATVAQNTWYHVCWTIQQVNTSYNTVGSAIWTVYLNGQQVYQSSAQRYPYPGKRSLNFLAYNGLNNIYLNGSVDDYRTYQTVLTSDEIQNIYNTTNVFQ